MSWLDDVLQGKRPENLYEVLDCTRFSTHDQIVTEYRRKVLQCHPDTHPNDEAAKRRFQLLARAHSILSDPRERALYDQWQATGLLVPYDVWRKDQSDHHPALHWSSAGAVPAISHSTTPPYASSSSSSSSSASLSTPSTAPSLPSPSPPPTASSSSQKTLREQFRNYDI